MKTAFTIITLVKIDLQIKIKMIPNTCVFVVKKISI